MSGLKAVMRVSPQLAKVVGQSEMPRTEAVKRM
jgi:chromatin remodeling complex protein RSC6